MDARQLITDLVPALARNAAVVKIEQADDRYRVTIAGTTGVEARCDVARATVEAAVEREAERAALAEILKACADRTVAEVPDGRG